MASLDSKIPKGPLSDKWTNHKSHINLVSPANKRLIDIIVVGTGIISTAKSKKINGGYLSFKEAFSSYFITIAIALIIHTLVSIIIFKGEFNYSCNF